MGKEALRRWVQQAQIDRGERDGLTSSESEQIKALKRENRDLKEANEILRQASISLRGNSTPDNTDYGFHRFDAGPGIRGRVDLCRAQ